MSLLACQSMRDWPVHPYEKPGSNGFDVENSLVSMFARLEMEYTYIVVKKSVVKATLTAWHNRSPQLL